MRSLSSGVNTANFRGSAFLDPQDQYTTPGGRGSHCTAVRPGPPRTAEGIQLLKGSDRCVCPCRHVFQETAALVICWQPGCDFSSGSQRRLTVWTLGSTPRDLGFSNGQPLFPPQFQIDSLEQKAARVRLKTL